MQQSEQIKIIVINIYQALPMSSALMLNTVGTYLILIAPTGFEPDTFQNALNVLIHLFFTIIV